MKKMLRGFLLLAGFLGWHAASAQYCTPTYGSGCTFQDDLNSFSISNLNHLNTGCGPNNGYENYTATVGVDTIQLEQGVQYPFTATTNYIGSEFLAIWIDFNNDQDFADPGELLYTSASFGSGSPLSAAIVMPTGQTTGYRRMRARIIYALNGAPDPCNNYSFGETHDYTVNVLPVPSCLPVINLSVPNITIGSTQAVATWTSTGNDFDVEYGLAGFTQGSGTLVTNVATPSYTMLGLTPNTNYDVYVRRDCGVNGFSTWSKKSFFTKCAATALPFTEDFNTWPPNCFDLTGATKSFTSYNLSGGGIAAMAQTNNWFSQDSAYMTTQPFIITAASRIKFKWSHTYNQFAPSESILIEAKSVSATNYSDTLFYKSGTNFESNDGAFGWMPGSFVQELANIPSSLIGSNVVIRVTIQSQGFGNNFWMDDFTVEVQPACAEPTNFSFTNVGYNQVTFSFNQATTTNYQLDWGPCGFAQGTASTLVNFTGTSYTLTGLAPNTCYDFYLRTDCNPANGYSSFMGPYSVTTNCAENATWSENFDLLPIYQPASCWKMINPGPGVASQTVFPPFGLTPPSTPNILEYYNGSATTSYLVTPALIGLDSDSNQVKFKVASQSSSPGQTMYIGTLSSNTSAASFNPVDTIVISNNWQDFIIMMDNVPAGHDYVAIRSALPLFTSAFIDNFVYEPIPSCIPPVNVVVAGTGSTQATLTFGAGGANLYNYEWGACGFTQGTGTFLNGQTGTTQVITGLAPGTCYDVYVQTDCGVNGGSSPWVGPISFTTLCLPAAMPYTQDFTNWPPTCFSLVNGGFDWEHDATNGYAVAEFWFNFSGKATMVTQSVTISQEAQVKFLWAHQFQTFYPDEQLILRAQIVGNTSWDTLTVLAGPTFNSPNAQPTTPPAKTDFVEELVYLDSATYTGQVVVFELIGVTDYGPHCYVDDFTVEAAPACVPATGLTVTGSTATTSTLDWNVSGNGTSNVEWGPQGFVQGTGTAITGLTNSTYLLTGLSGNTCYDYYVQVNCGVAGTSTWAGPYTWCTPCTNDTIPYLQDFNAPQVPSCFTVDPVSTGPFSPAWQFDGQYAYAPFWNFSSGTILMDAKQVYIATNAQVSFAWAHQYQTFYPDDQVILLARPVGQATWDTLIDLIGPTFNSPNSAPTTPPGNKNDFITETILLNPVTYTGQIAEFRFVGVTDFGPNAYIDDFLVEAVPSCPKPTALASANITQTAADLSWTSNAPGSSWQISYGPPSGTAASGTKVSAPTNPFTLTGLSASSNYCFYVREICGPGDTSSWSNSGCFTTACGAVTLPYTEDFSATTLSTCWANYNLSGNTSPNALWRNTSTSWPNYAAQGQIDNTGNGGYAMGVDGSTPYPLNDIMLETPELIFTGVPSPELSFYMFSSVAGFGTSSDLNELYVDFYDGTSWIDSVFYFKGDSANWFQVTVPLGAYPVSGGNAKIRFRLNKVGATAFYNDIIIDDINVASGAACPPPTGVSSTNVVCDGFAINFTSGSGTTQVEYGPTGFTPGTGTVVNPATSPLSVTGLTPGTGYEYYVTDLCGGALGTPAGPFTATTATGPLPVAAFSAGTITVGPSSASVPFDASASTGGTSYAWDFGNATTGSGVNATGTYTTNGVYTVTLVVTNGCGSDTLTQQVTVAGIGVADLALANSFEVFPNPAKGKVSVSFSLLFAHAATVEMLDLSGRVIWSESAQVNGTYRTDIDLSNMAAGVYLVRVNSADGVATKRLVVE